MIYFPEKIKSIVGEEPYTQNEVGMSGSTVLIFEKHVLKIQKQTLETDNEYAIVSWLQGKLPLPKIEAYCVEDEMAYTLMTKVEGYMLCEEEYMYAPERLLDLVAQGMHMLWEVDIKECPFRVSRLDERLKAARYNVEHDLVDLDNVEPETFGPEGFADPMELLCWLEDNRPEEDLVLTHGDFCLPNVFVSRGEDNSDAISGFIDLGKMGPADRWQDVAIALRSLKHNAAGYFSEGKSYFPFTPDMLLERLGIPMDEEKNRYYMLLDELF